MKRKAKSVISILLCLVMILQFMPALAEETTPEIVVNQTFNNIETNDCLSNKFITAFCIVFQGTGMDLQGLGNTSILSAPNNEFS